MTKLTQHLLEGSSSIFPEHLSDDEAKEVELLLACLRSKRFFIGAIWEGEPQFSWTFSQINIRVFQDQKVAERYNQPGGTVGWSSRSERDYTVERENIFWEIVGRFGFTAGRLSNSATYLYDKAQVKILYMAPYVT